MPLPPARHRAIRHTFLMVSALYLSGYDGGTGEDEGGADTTTEHAKRLEEVVGPVIALITAPDLKAGAA